MIKKTKLICQESHQLARSKPAPTISLSLLAKIHMIISAGHHITQRLSLKFPHLCPHTFKIRCDPGCMNGQFLHGLILLSPAIELTGRYPQSTAMSSHPQVLLTRVILILRALPVMHFAILKRKLLLEQAAHELCLRYRRRSVEIHLMALSIAENH